ncbi:MAG: hypothetical protein WA160_16010 [Pseudobdellovibrio sp.]
MNVKIETNENFEFIQSKPEQIIEKQISLFETKKNISVELTERDFEIIQFIIEMKFASIDDIFKKFFKTKLNSETAKSSAWAKKRLFQLEKGRFIKSIYSFSESTRFYVGTFKGYYALSQIKSSEFLIKPNLGFDQRTFSHDRKVLNSRLRLEETKTGSDWQSERKLKSNALIMRGLTSVYIPDGLYLDISGNKVAFELEIAIKSKSRYKDKIKKYLTIMRFEKDEDKLFNKVHYVCEKETLKEYLIKETKIYGSFFKIETINEFMKQR